MGFDMTLTIGLDHLEKLLEDPEQFCGLLKEAARGHKTRRFAGGYLVTQRKRHGDDSTVYVFMRGSLDEMTAFSPDAKSLLESNPEAYKRRLDYLKTTVRELTDAYKTHQAGLKQPKGEK